MVNIALMLVGEFDNVKKNSASKDESDMYIRNGEILSRDDLSFELFGQLNITHNFEKAISEIDYEYFLSHLQAEFPVLRLRYNFEMVRDPYATIEALRAFARRSFLRGTCKVCESWYQE
jgi:hypothetical protein